MGQVLIMRTNHSLVQGIRNKAQRGENSRSAQPARLSKSTCAVLVIRRRKESRISSSDSKAFLCCDISRTNEVAYLFSTEVSEVEHVSRDSLLRQLTSLPGNHS